MNVEHDDTSSHLPTPGAQASRSQVFALLCPGLAHALSETYEGVLLPDNLEGPIPIVVELRDVGSILTGNVKAAQVVKLRRAKTLNGAYVRIGVKGQRVYLNRTTRVTKTDIGATNGTIHVIDGVLIPPAS